MEELSMPDDTNEAKMEKAIRRRLQRLIHLHASRNDSNYSVDFYQLCLRIAPGVFCPAYGEGSTLLARCLENNSADAVWDVGTGSGAIALLAAKGGASKVVATDCQTAAIQCARRNARVSNLESRIDIRVGDLCEPIGKEEQFDLITFNPPFMRRADHYGLSTENEHSRSLETAIFDDTRVLERFFTCVSRHLAPLGRILLAYSNIGDMELLGDQIRAAGFHSKTLAEFGETLRFYAFELCRRDEL